MEIQPQLRKVNKRSRWEYDAFPLFDALTSCHSFVSFTTGADPMVSKAEHAELSKNVQEMKKNLSSLEENSVSDTALKHLVGTLVIQLVSCLLFG